MQDNARTSWSQRHPQHRRSAAWLLALLPWMPLAAAQEAAEADPALQTVAALVANDAVSFNTAFLHGHTSPTDLRALLSRSQVPEGVQRVDLLVNRERIGRRDIRFAHNPVTRDIEPCFDLDALEQMGIDLDKLPQRPPQDDTCLYLPTWVPAATATYESSQLQLLLGIPHLYLRPEKRGYVDPSLRDAGTVAGFLNYGVNARHDESPTLSGSDTMSADLRAGFNLGDWRLRSNAYFTTGSGRDSAFTHQNTYAQRDIAALDSQLVAGQTYTQSPLFDSVRFLGVQMRSDDAMRPDSAQGYAPIIRGSAASNATVEVRQGGYVIYTANVAPGPFAITDLAPSGANGDLDITVIEADGSRRTQRQAFSSPPLMVREGQFNYDIAAGQVRLNDQAGERPHFASGSLLYGVHANATVAAGAQVAEDFTAVSLGTGINTRWGAVSLDSTHASSHGHANASEGASLNLRYSKLVEATRSNVSVTMRQDLSRGYRTLPEHIIAADAASGAIAYSPRNVRQRLNANINQPLQAGTLHVSASHDRHWEGSASNSVSASYSNSFGRMSYNVAYTHTRSLQLGSNASRDRDSQLMLSMNFPLGRDAKAPQGFANAAHDRHGNNLQTGAVGRLPVGQDTSYAVTAGRTDRGDSTASVNLGTATPFARLDAGYAYSDNYRSAHASANGSVVAHRDGVNFGQPLGETIMLAQVEPPVAGVGVASHAGVRTGANGYAIIPSATPYRRNHVSLDTRSAPRNAEFENRVQEVVPTRGAIAVARFTSQTGQRVQFELYDSEGKRLPFGAMVRDAKGQQLGMTDPRGRILTLIPAEARRGYLEVSQEGDLCHAHYELPAPTTEQNYQLLRLTCSAPSYSPAAPGSLASQERSRAGAA